MTEPIRLRFAVGTFDAWPGLQAALDDLRLRGLVPDSFNCLALARLFAGRTIVAPSREAVTVEELGFPEDVEPICCTKGPLCECLQERRRSGARSLKDALGAWLVPRHAAHFQGAVERGGILLWIHLTGSEDERRAYRSLLAHSSNSVGVHDLTASGGPSPGRLT